MSTVTWIFHILMKFVCFITVQNNIYISTECVRSTVSANGPHSDTILGLNEWLNVPINTPVGQPIPNTNSISVKSNWKHVIMASIKLPCYVPTTVKYYLFSHLLVFVIHILPTYTWGNQPHQNSTKKPTTFSLWKHSVNIIEDYHSWAK